VAPTRRLAAIMFTDTVGYTASTQTDEARTLDLLRQQEELVRPLLSLHQGREIKSTGDGLLVEFDSALKATQCAVSIQRRIYERNAEVGLPTLQIRIGIHLGDVVKRDADILGDTVNIAARIEPLADPGGICVSGAVHEQIRNKIPEKLEKLIPTTLKGLEVPMDIYRVVLPWTAPATPTAALGPTGIAVLPFTNISPDPNDAYFADGLTEEVITALSQLRELRVIARTSVMRYKSATKGISEIAKELGVSAVLEGSVRKSGNRLRISAQLINAGSEGHLWAKTYDRELDDVFAVQGELAKQVAEALKVELRPTEERRLEGRAAIRPDSYLAYLKGRGLEREYTRDSLSSAMKLFELAIALDDGNAAALAELAHATYLYTIWYTDKSSPNWLETSRRLTEQAIKLDPNLAEAHRSLALILQDVYDYRGAEREFRLSLSLNPSYSDARVSYALSLEEEGRADDALLELRLAEAADPLWSFVVDCLATLLIWMGRLDEAQSKLHRLGELGPRDSRYHRLLADYSLARSDPQQAINEMRRAEELEDEPRLKPILRARRCVLSGEEEQARAVLVQEDARVDFGLIPTEIAHIYAEMGDLDECFRWIERAIGRRSLAFQKIRLDPRLSHVRGDFRFERVLKELNLS
jgi:adenylate cyclase